MTGARQHLEEDAEAAVSWKHEHDLRKYATVATKTTTNNRATHMQGVARGTTMKHSKKQACKHHITSVHERAERNEAKRSEAG